MRKIVTAAIQMQCVEDRQQNIDHAAALVRQAGQLLEKGEAAL